MLNRKLVEFQVKSLTTVMFGQEISRSNNQKSITRSSPLVDDSKGQAEKQNNLSKAFIINSLARS